MPPTPTPTAPPLSPQSPWYVVGAGGIGCAVAYFLRAAGAPLTVVDADAGKVRWGRANGLRVDDRPPLSAPFLDFDDWRPEPGCVVLLCTKCYDNRAVLARLPDDAVVVPVQNGFDPFLEERTAGAEGIASFVSECHPGQTHTRLTRNGKLHLGPRSADAAARAHDLLTTLADRLRRTAPFPVEVVPDILPFKYTKLMYNAAISPLAAAAGLDNGQLLSLKAARELFFELLQENYAILRGGGVRLARIGPFHPRTVSRILRRRAVARALSWAFYPSLRHTYCSMSRDLPAGRTKIDYYNRHLIDLAGGRPCPLNRRVYGLVKRMERDRLPTGPHRLHELRAG